MAIAVLLVVTMPHLLDQLSDPAFSSSKGLFELPDLQCRLRMGNMDNCQLHCILNAGLGGRAENVPADNVMHTQQSRHAPVVQSVPCLQ